MSPHDARISAPLIITAFVALCAQAPNTEAATEELEQSFSSTVSAQPYDANSSLSTDQDSSDGTPCSTPDHESRGATVTTFKFTFEDPSPDSDVKRRKTFHQQGGADEDELCQDDEGGPRKSLEQFTREVCEARVRWWDKQHQLIQDMVCVCMRGMCV